MSPINAEISNFFWDNKAIPLMAFISCLWNLSYWSWYRIIKVYLWIGSISIHKETTSLSQSWVRFHCSVSHLLLLIFKNTCTLSFSILHSNNSVSPPSSNLSSSFIYIHTLLFDNIILLHFATHFKNMFSSFFRSLHEDLLFMDVTETVKQVLLFHKKGLSFWSFLIEISFSTLIFKSFWTLH